MSLNLWKQPIGDIAMFPSLDFGWAAPSSLQEVQKLTKDFVPIMGTDLIETTNDYNVHVDLPGVEASDLDISIVDKNLVIKAERKRVHEESTDRIHSLERAFGKVERQIRLPNNADTDHVVTAFKNGVLTIQFPKKLQEGQVKKLHISNI